MQVVERKVLDQVQVITQSGIILVRFVLQKWVVGENQEILVEPKSGLHRYSIVPGDWALAEELGVRSYAETAWTPELLQLSSNNTLSSAQKLSQ